MRERIVTAEDQLGDAAPLKPEPAFVPAPFYRANYYRDQTAPVFHFFPDGGGTAICGVSRMAKGRMRGWTNLTCERQRICPACLCLKSAAAGKTPAQGMPREKVLMRIDSAVLAEIDRRVGRNLRVQWIQSAIRHTLAWEDAQKQKSEDGKAGTRP